LGDGGHHGEIGNRRLQTRKILQSRPPTPMRDVKPTVRAFSTVPESSTVRRRGRARDQLRLAGMGINHHPQTWFAILEITPGRAETDGSTAEHVVPDGRSCGLAWAEWSTPSRLAGRIL
jgi:hypothetical protein